MENERNVVMKVITFGEVMLRLAPEGYYRFTQADKFGATYGGGEANVAVSLANYGVDVAFVSKIVNNPIGDAAINSLRKYGVDTSLITRGGERLGIYYLEKGASQRPSKVVYDRAHSSISEAKQEDFDWNKIFEGVDLFHFTGITPALGDNVAEITLTAAQEAKKRNITVTCDLNYRKKLWSKEKANKVMSELAKLNREGTTIMLITHDVKVAAKCTRVIYIVDGNIKGEYNLNRYENESQMRERERALNNWLMEMGW